MYVVEIGNESLGKNFISEDMLVDIVGLVHKFFPLFIPQ